MKRVTLILTITTFAFAILTYSLWQDPHQLPINNPSTCNKNLRDSTNKIWVAFGDSITSNTLASDYVKIVQNSYNKKSLYAINGGENRDLSYNLLQRIDSVINCQPDFVTILIGTNDMYGALSKENGDRAIKVRSLPQTPTYDWYISNLKRIVKILKQKTDAKIGVISIPPFGEDIDSKNNQIVYKYVKGIKEISIEYNIAYIPLFKRFSNFLNKKTIATKKCTGTNHDTTSSFIQHYFLKRSWNSISKSRGFHLTTDCLHFNDTGATLIAELVMNFINQNM